MRKKQTVLYRAKKITALAFTMITCTGLIPFQQIPVFAQETVETVEAEEQTNVLLNLKSRFIGGNESCKADYGDFVTNKDYEVTAEVDGSEMKITDFYVIPGISEEDFSNLSDSVKLDKNEIAKLENVNSFTIPSKEESSGNTYPTVVVFYSKTAPAESTTVYGQRDDGCYCYAKQTDIQILTDQLGEWTEYTDTETSVTWYYKEMDGFAYNLHTMDDNTNGLLIGTDTLNIPAIINGLTVKSIGGGTKERPFVPQKINSYTEILFPETVETIEKYAFYKDEAFVRLAIPNTVKNIEDFAFFGCNNYKTVSITADGLNIGKGAFANSKAITSVSITGTTSIGEIAFAECSALNKILLNGQFTLGTHSFYNNSNVSTLNINGMTGEIGTGAFENNSGLSSLYIPSGIILNENSFAGCKGLKKLEVNVTELPNNSFRGCSNIEQFITGSMVSVVGYAWGGYSDEIQTLSNKKTVPTNVYIKSNDTVFETYSDGNNFYSAFMGRSSIEGKYNNYREVKVYLADTESFEFNDLSSDTETCYAASPTVYAKDEALYSSLYNANGAIHVTFESINKDVSGNAVYPEITGTAQVRDGIDAFYNGVVYTDNSILKDNIIVYPTFADASMATTKLDEFYFYEEKEMKTSIEEWIASESAGKDEDGYTGFVLKDVTGYDNSPKGHAYGWFEAHYASGDITLEAFNKEKNAMTEAVFADKKLFLEAGAYKQALDNADVTWTPSNGESNGIQTMSVIYYPGSSISENEIGSSVAEPVYYKTTVSIQVIYNGVNKEENTEKGIDFAPIMQGINELKEKITVESTNIEALKVQLKSLSEVSDTGEMKVQVEKLNLLIMEKEKLISELTISYNDLVERLQYFCENNLADELGRNGSENGNEIANIYIEAVCYEYDENAGRDAVNSENHTVIMHTAKGDPLKNGSETFDFYLMLDGIHVMDGASEVVFDKTLDEYEKEASDVLQEIRTILESMNKVMENAAEEAKGYTDELAKQGITINTQASSEDPLAQIKEEVQNLIVQYSEVKDEYATTIGAIYEDDMSTEELLTGGVLDELLVKLEELKDSTSNLISRIETTLETETLTNEERASLEALLTRVKSVQNALNTDIPLIEDIMEALKVENPDEIIDSIRTLHDQIKTLSENAAALSLNNEHLLEQINALQQDINDCNAKLEELEAKNLELAEENTKLKLQIASLSDNGSKYTELTKQVADLTYEKNTIANENLELTNANKTLTTKVNTLTTQITSLTAKNTSLTNDVSTLKTEKTSLTNKNNTLNSKVTSLTSQVNSLTSKVNDLTTKNNSLQQQLTAAQKNSSSSGGSTSGTVTKSSSSSSKGYEIVTKSSSSSSSKAVIEPVQSQSNGIVMQPAQQTLPLDATAESTNYNKKVDISDFETSQSNDSDVAEVSSNGAQPVPVEVEEKSSSNTGVIILGFILFLIVAGCGAAVYIFVFKKKKNDIDIDEDILENEDDVFLPEEEVDEYTDDIPEE